MPTPVEHYETAEALLAEAAGAPDPLTAARLSARAGVHAQLATVPWAVDDRGLEEVARGLNGEQVAALLAVVTELDQWRGAGVVERLPQLAPDTDPLEAWVAGFSAAVELVGRLVTPVADEVLDR